MSGNNALKPTGAARPGKMIAVGGAKGGIGKNLFVANLGVGYLGIRLPAGNIAGQPVEIGQVRCCRADHGHLRNPHHGGCLLHIKSG